MPASGPVEVAAPSLEGAAGAMMLELRTSLEGVVAALPGSIRRAVDLERSLGLDKKLAWQVFRLVNSVGLAELPNVPSRPSVRRLLEAARRRRVPREVLDRVLAAFERFDDFAVVHAGDREGLISVLGGVTGEKGEQLELKVRKALFRASAHVWGAQAEMQIRTGIWHAKPPPLQVDDVALVMGDIGMQRLRETAPLSIVRWMRTGASPHTHPTGERAGAGAGGAERMVEHEVGLLHEFCTHPLPKMVPKAGVPGGVETELIIPAGRAGAVTIYSSQVHENAERTPQACYDGRMFITMPAETVVWDLVLPAGRTDAGTARVVVYGRRPHPEQVYEERGADLLPQKETVRYLGALEGVPPIDGAPGYPEAVRHVLRELGWMGTRFDVYRCRVQYPVLHTLLVVRVDAARR